MEMHRTLSLPHQGEGGPPALAPVVGEAIYLRSTGVVPHFTAPSCTKDIPVYIIAYLLKTVIDIIICISQNTDALAL